MITSVKLKEGPHLRDYKAYASLSTTVQNFENEARHSIKGLNNARIWMINSTSKGGGVAEMMPNILRIMKELGLETNWMVMDVEDEKFFNLTKRLHNLIHGEGDSELDEEDRELYEKVNKQCADALKKKIKKGDIIVIHDPQPMPMAKWLKEDGISLIWRSHIGIDHKNEKTDSVWGFLTTYFQYYDHFVFSVPEYIPENLSARVSIIPPGIDPLSHKNRNLKIQKISGILKCSGLIPEGPPTIATEFQQQVKRVMADGTIKLASEFEDIGIMHRTIVTQVSRWDRLKGFAPLLKGFVHLKKNINKFHNNDPRHKKRLEIMRIVLAGPDPEHVTDDPEGNKVLKELREIYASIEDKNSGDVAILLLPMESAKENALIVNAIQRCSSVVVQNSIQEGFGLTVTEAMWKKAPILGTNACGLRYQVRDEIDGRLNPDPENHEKVAEFLNIMLMNSKQREVWGYSAQNRVINNYLIFSQVSNWLNVFLKIS